MFDFLKVYKTIKMNETSGRNSIIYIYTHFEHIILMLRVEWHGSEIGSGSVRQIITVQILHIQTESLLFLILVSIRARIKLLILKPIRIQWREIYGTQGVGSVSVIQIMPMHISSY